MVKEGTVYARVFTPVSTRYDSITNAPCLAIVEPVSSTKKLARVLVVSAREGAARSVSSVITQIPV